MFEKKNDAWIEDGPHGLRHVLEFGFGHRHITPAVIESPVVNFAHGQNFFAEPCHVRIAKAEARQASPDKLGPAPEPLRIQVLPRALVSPHAPPALESITQKELLVIGWIVRHED